MSNKALDPKSIPLPEGWEEKFDFNLKRLFYIDHNTQTTSWEDPRIKILQASTAANNSSRSPNTSHENRGKTPAISTTAQKTSYAETGVKTTNQTLFKEVTKKKETTTNASGVSSTKGPATFSGESSLHQASETKWEPTNWTPTVWNSSALSDAANPSTSSVGRADSNKNRAPAYTAPAYTAPAKSGSQPQKTSQQQQPTTSSSADIGSKSSIKTENNKPSASPKNVKSTTGNKEAKQQTTATTTSNASLKPSDKSSLSASKGSLRDTTEESNQFTSRDEVKPPNEVASDDGKISTDFLKEQFSNSAGNERNNLGPNSSLAVGPNRSLAVGPLKGNLLAEKNYIARGPNPDLVCGPSALNRIRSSTAAGAN